MNLSSLSIRLFFIVYCVVSSEVDDWSPSQYHEFLVDSEFVEVINDFKTVEIPHNNRPIQFSQSEIELLNKLCNGDNICVEEKNGPIIKFKAKMEAIQCVNGVIVYYLLYKVKEETAANNYSSYEYAQKIMSRMLSVLLIGRTFAHSWLWTTYIRILAAYTWPYVFLTDNYLDYPEREEELLSYIRRCQSNSYLPMSTVEPSDIRTYCTSLVNMDIVEYSDQLYGFQFNKKFTDQYSISRAFKLYYFVLEDFFHRETDVFGPPNQDNVKWGRSKELLRAQRDTLTATYRTVKWMKDPFLFTEYHTRLLRVIKVKSYYHIWWQLSQFELILNKAEIHIGRVSLKVFDNRVWRVLCDTLLEIVNEFIYDDSVIFCITHQICTEIKEFNEEFMKKLRLMENGIREKISSDLKALGVDDDDIRATFDVKLEENNKPETKETICGDLVLLGADEKDTINALYGIPDETQHTNIEDGQSSVTNDNPGGQHDDVETAPIDDGSTIINNSPNSIRSCKHHVTENPFFINEKIFTGYGNNLFLKLDPLNYYFIWYFTNGNKNLDTTFFDQPIV